MFFSYDSEGDVLEVIFEEGSHHLDQMAFELRKGILLFFTVKDFKLVQLTLVSYRELAQMPVVALPSGASSSPQPQSASCQSSLPRR